MVQNAGATSERALQDDWVLRVLGVETAQRESSAPEPTHGALPQSGSDPLGVWRDAKDRVNDQLEKLRLAFMKTRHPLAGAACEAGLGGFSGGIFTTFQVALIEFNTADGRDRIARAEKVRQLGGKLGKFIATSDMLPILEANPFGVRLTLRTDVLSAIERIGREMALIAATGGRSP